MTPAPSKEPDDSVLLETARQAVRGKFNFIGEKDLLFCAVPSRIKKEHEKRGRKKHFISLNEPTWQDEVCAQAMQPINEAVRAKKMSELWNSLPSGMSESQIGVMEQLTLAGAATVMETLGHKQATSNYRYRQGIVREQHGITTDAPLHSDHWQTRFLRELNVGSDKGNNKLKT